MPSAGALRTRAAVAATCVAVLAAVAVLLHRRRRRNRVPASRRHLGWRRGRPRRACEEEEKPQDRFKRVLADNSYSAFKHLRRQGGQPGGAGSEATPTLPEGAACSTRLSLRYESRLNYWKPLCRLPYEISTCIPYYCANCTLVHLWLESTIRIHLQNPRIWSEPLVMILLRDTL
ncbi:hypothetical protein PR202_gb20957 [Eleusine coracana subsp. coracana]|uniref:Uncharacterized protein n=1 Tax=Eleusine coracana subsp. coracana TaxID=191504 RepID=A0AAV5FDW0_ELECO|nr:hypothetical protein PR202_gb20957 [Eleusine coracana subsp. coracana]